MASVIRQHLRTIFMVIMMIVGSNYSYADKMQQVFDQTIAQQHDLKSNALSHFKNFDPYSNFDHYSSSPSQTQYYDGVTQSNTSQFNQDVQAAKKSDANSNAIDSSIHSHPSFVVTLNDSDINHSKYIQDNAESIVKGVTNEYVNCESKQVCKISFQKKMCDEEPQEITQVCTKTLNIDVIPHESVTHYTLIAHVKTSDHNYAGVVINAVTGAISFIGPHETKFSLEGRLPKSLNCQGLQGAVTSYNDHGRGTHLDYINFPSCENGMALGFHLTSSKTINLDMQVDIMAKEITYQTKDRWVENCDGLLQEPSCQFKSKTCTQPSETRTIQGISVTRDCWQETDSYLCHGGSGEGNCSAFHTEGCEQINSVCKEKKNNTCVLYEQTFQCPIQTCSSSSNISCGDGSNYCLDGNCVDHSYQESQDFAKAVSGLSAVSDASKELDPNSMTMFSGHSAECREIPVGFSNCCSNTGWGQDIDLANCSNEEKKLHDAKEKKLAIFVGKYCSGPDPIPCLEHAQVYCVFDSKLAKIIQEQGRKGQLQIGFGNAESPNCLGITSNQLQAINFDKINFQDFYADINTKEPDMDLIQQRIDEEAKQFQNAGQING